MRSTLGACMKIIFSRKGFDTKSGSAPSPIIDGVPHSLPIPTRKYPSVTTYGMLGLGDMVSNANPDYSGNSFCHEDPMFWKNRCAFGQTGAAQSHLKNKEVDVGDVFLFFGLFAELGSNDHHHRIFGYLKVENVLKIGSEPSGKEVDGTPRQHPDTIAKWDDASRRWDSNNTVYLGRGEKARKAHPDLRLTKRGGPTSIWVVPAWLRETEVTYHKHR